MTYNYCTLFDSFFLSRGLALYESLKDTTPNFRLFIFPFDKKADEVLRALQLPDVTVVSQSDFENDHLLKIKGERSRGEYCWTCTPVIVDYCISRFNLTQCTYLDADLYFFSSANQLIDEMGEKSVMITDHRYTARYDQSKRSGKYCVQFMTFKNDERGRQVLSWWKEKCLDWCYDRFEDGKFGDQKYLDDWTTRFHGVYDSPNEGAGIAPWNIQQYTIQEDKIITNKRNGKKWPLVFYHFHGVKFLDVNRVDIGSYLLTDRVISKIYAPYLEKLALKNWELQRERKINHPIQRYGTKSGIPTPLHKLIRKMLGVYNVFSIKTPADSSSI